MFRAFFDGVASLLGWRVAEAAVRGVRREMGRSARAKTASAQAALADEIAECVRALPGGTAKTAIVVASSSQVEPHAADLTCVACDGALSLDQHRAVTVDARPVRIVDLACRRCGAARQVYFAIDRSLLG